MKEDTTMSELGESFKEVQNELNELRAAGLQGEQLTQVLLYAILQELESLNNDDEDLSSESSY